MGSGDGGAAVPTEAEKAEDLSAEPADGADVNAEAKRLVAMSSQDLVKKDVPSAVSALQKASGLLDKKNQTEDQHADGVYYCEMALLEPKRLGNYILSEPLEGLPEGNESGEDPDVPSASNLDEKEEEELRRQGYGPMSVKDEKANKVNGDSKEKEAEEAKAEVLKWDKSSDVPETKVKVEEATAKVGIATEDAEDSEAALKPEETPAQNNGKVVQMRGKGASRKKHVLLKQQCKTKGFAADALLRASGYYKEG
ncbi:histone-binding protein N1/N2-like [Bufo gargarizans]|uniref:histone-binding protein N1/N2-like n=1 Tax=Bufo gargarizans TaxID=30331 RepID=UPI001CF3B0C8|nr:histone-binding protein N1/N2-like [Bufo gargarizans]